MSVYGFALSMSMPMSVSISMPMSLSICMPVSMSNGYVEVYIFAHAYSQDLVLRNSSKEPDSGNPIVLYNK